MFFLLFLNQYCDYSSGEISLEVDNWFDYWTVCSMKHSHLRYPYNTFCLLSALGNLVFSVRQITWSDE